MQQEVHFEPVTYNGNVCDWTINNALIFPGLGLGIKSASVMTDGMFSSGCRSSMVDTSQPGEPILPEVEELRNISEMVAIEVAKVAVAEGVARVNLSDNDIKMARSNVEARVSPNKAVEKVRI